MTEEIKADYMEQKLILAALLALSTDPSFADVITFDTISETAKVSADGVLYEEDGFTVTLIRARSGALDFGRAFGSNNVLFADTNLDTIGQLYITAPFAFDIMSFSLSPGESRYGYFESSSSFVPVSFDNVRLTADSFAETLDSSLRNGIVELLETYRNLTSFGIAFAELPFFDDFPTNPSEPACYTTPCTLFTIDNIVLEPSQPSVIPLPSTASTSVIAFLGLFWIGVCRRRFTTSEA